MGRHYRADKGSKEVQTLRYENQKLKKENARLRRQLQRVDLNRFQNLSELVNKKFKEDKIEAKSKKLEALKQKWECFSCGRGILRLMIYDHPVKGAMYFRKCDQAGCGHRTEMQKYTPEVEGITENDEIKDKDSQNDTP
jgi:hypothetical protein